MKRKGYESPQLELILIGEDVLTESGDNYENDPWGGFDY